MKEMSTEVKNKKAISELPEEESFEEYMERRVEEDIYTEMSNVVKDELQGEVKPEILNRIDEIIIFSPLSGNDLDSIAANILDQTASRAYKERQIRAIPGKSLLQQIVSEGGATAAQFGARPMRRAVQRYFEDTLSEVIVQGFLTDGDSATVELHSDGNKAIITREKDGASFEASIEDA
eukprot:CAMPEP_0178959928 /NCGR_PEP_ID=MMETSP0789-20121207/12614_1 /TAXON_ID=3005 /ORGANISM="Rhizosolenia setigera, Strain CCMP 1694" /LENGTH=178 /DNA_ID=CAMNT_0020643087 /DNA_START=27 /DNA_END=559 /DNA_ORIENTATION=-